MVGERAEIRQILSEQRVRHGRQQMGIGAGSDGEMSIGLRRGLTPPRVDHHDGAASRLDRFKPAREVGCGAQRAV